MKYSIENDEVMTAIPIHGSGTESLHALLKAYSLNHILEIIQNKSDFNISHRNYDLLINVSVHATTEECVEIFRSVFFIAWLKRMNRMLKQPENELDSHLLYLPVILIKYLPKFPGENYQCKIPLADQYCPIGTSWQVYTHTSSDDLAMISANHDGSIDLAAADTRIHISEACKVAVVRAGGSIQVAERVFITRYHIELLNSSFFGELSELRLAEEEPSEMDLADLEAAFTRSLDLIEDVWPECMPDISLLFNGVLPMSMPSHRWNSASTNELPYILQLTVRKDAWPFLLAESVIHELSHVKMDLYRSIVPVLLSDSAKIYKHPWRPDLRPISGVLLGAHAFLAVLKFYRQAAKIWPDNAPVQNEITIRRGEVQVALQILEEHARFTLEGNAIFAGMISAFGDN
ncbi:aKG-HExxH-type peptide beta-hydroxylase [Dyadobacter sp. Leaf189]|uniref:aKG-HExxH-type peptide beta-hydroxylase n=1 Tax=Dyadobacter sp. Leaf189 TaxID=1736295 RepID=UPI0007014871|nr:HEXXH motif-containing putative peptide modification protein [Dyadobacter sp. Leaf189]KQS27066.1 hypothetical protein ASG33_21270 [Dyadobacter sp. Leaf189]